MNLLPLALLAAVAQPDPTFTKDIAPILFEHCAACHRPNQIGPFALLSHADAKKRAELIARVTTKKMMPPWKPVGGEFIDDRSLTEQQIATIKKWADAGAPEGDPADLPPQPKFKDGWQLGTPDLVLTMPKPFTIPAEGDDIYQHFVFPLDIEKTKYIKAVEVLPGNRKVAHHAACLLDSSGMARRLAAKNVSYNRFGNPGFLPSGFTPGFVPGQTARFLQDDFAIAVKKGTDLVLQMHYHPTGKEETDQTTIGVYLSDVKPARNIGLFVVGTEAIDIPAGAARHTLTDRFTLPANFQVRDIWAHMHLTGKSVDVAAELPDGATKTLLRIDDWDFNWQDVYRYAKPFTLPKGTVVTATFVFDNSDQNPRNPNSPPKRIRWGERSDDEMAGVLIVGAAETWQGEIALIGGVVGHVLEIASKRTRR